MSAAWRVAAALLVLLLGGSCATPGPESVSAELRKEYAPTGKLRVGLLAGNPTYVTQGTPPGVQRGVAVDIGRELASRLGVPMDPVSYASADALWQGARRGEWDVGMLAIDAERAADMNFTSAYLFTSSSYLVTGTTIRSIADVDKPGHRVAVTSRSAQHLWLQKNLRFAQIVVTEATPAGAALLDDGKVEALAANEEQLRQWAGKIAGSRMLEGRFSENYIGLAVAKGRPAAFAHAYEFIEELKASGAVQDFVSREGLAGVRVAPARAK